jgi:hypothetical protein
MMNRNYNELLFVITIITSLFLTACGGEGGGDSGSGGGKCEISCTQPYTFDSTWEFHSSVSIEWCYEKYTKGSGICSASFNGEPMTGFDEYYRDFDNDGYGDPNYSIFRQSVPEGYVRNGSDCNDNDATINRGANEILDGIDNNCNSHIDETTYFLDGDGDMYGNPNIFVFIETPGYVTDNTDCNDNSALINPSAEEIPDNNIDDNCDGIIDPPGPEIVEFSVDNLIIIEGNETTLLTEFINGEGVVDNGVGVVTSSAGVSVSPTVTTTYTLTVTNNYGEQVSRVMTVLVIPASYSVPVVSNIIDAGEIITCAITDIGLVCWGYETNVPQLVDPFQVSVSINEQVICALDDSGVVCWGEKPYLSDIPVLNDPVQISVGGSYACVIDDTDVVCWGNNNGDIFDVPILNNPQQISAGLNHACALDDNGVVCWGANYSGQIDVPVLSNPVQISAGYGFTCALDDSGVVTWGIVDVPEFSNPVQVSCHGGGICAIDDSGVVCGGALSYGIPELTNPVQVSVGSHHACATDNNGIVCWGADFSGEINVPDELSYR